MKFLARKKTALPLTNVANKNSRVILKSRDCFLLRGKLFRLVTKFPPFAVGERRQRRFFIARETASSSLLPPPPEIIHRHGADGSVVAVVAAIIRLMRAIIVMLYNFAFAHDVASVVFVFVNNIVFVDCVVLIFYDVLVFYNSLRTGTIKNLPNNRFVFA